MARLTPDEGKVLRLLANAWNAFLELPVEHGDDQTEFRHIIHAAQEKVLARPTRRSMADLPADFGDEADDTEIPAAMSAFPGFPGFRPDFNEFASRVDILVDGEPQTKVIAYDIEAGTVTRFIGQAAGSISLKRARDPANHDVVTGKVTVVDHDA